MIGVETDQRRSSKLSSLLLNSKEGGLLGR